MPLFPAIPVRSILAAGMPDSPTELAAFIGVLCTAILIALAAINIISALFRARGTTLIAPLAWSLVSLVYLSGLAVAYPRFVATQHKQLGEDLWLIGLVSSFCPLVALLGAKRPQQGIWQYIVFSFWFIAAMPAFEALLTNPYDKFGMPPLWLWFYGLLWLLGLVNYLPTRNFLPSLLAAAGQLWFLWHFLPIDENLLNTEPLIGVLLLSAAICLANALARRAPTRWRGKKGDDWTQLESGAAPLFGWTQVWLDFRNAYGMVWSARMQERINALLDASQAPVWLEWDGFHAPLPQTEESPVTALPESNTTAVAELDAPRSVAATADQSITRLQETFATVEPGLRNLFRRFVSNDWINRRLNFRPLTTLPT